MSYQVTKPTYPNQNPLHKSNGREISSQQPSSQSMQFPQNPVPSHINPMQMHVPQVVPQVPHAQFLRIPQSNIQQVQSPQSNISFLSKPVSIEENSDSSISSELTQTNLKRKFDHPAGPENKNEEQVEIVRKMITTTSKGIKKETINDKGIKEGKAKETFHTGLVRKYENHNGAQYGKVIESIGGKKTEYTGVDGKKEGKEIIIFPNGGLNENWYKKDKLEKSNITSPNGSTLQKQEKGNFIYRYSNGDKAVWKSEDPDNLYNGNGTLTLNNGHSMQCKVKLDKPATFTFTNENGKKFIYKDGYRQSEEPVPYTSDSETESEGV